MSKRIVAIQGYKLPAERVWVTHDDMYEVYSKIDLMIDDTPLTEFVITDILDEGVVVEVLH